MASSGPPKWVYPVLGVLGLGIVALGLGIYKVVSVPPPPPPAPPQIVVPALVAPPVPAPAAAPSPGGPAPAESAKPAATEEKPGEEKGATEKKKPSGKSGKSVAKAQPEASSPGKGAQPTPEPAAPAPAPPKPKKGGSIDDLLDQVGSNRRGGGGEEPKPKKAPAAALPALSQSDIVSAMKAVQPRVKECYNQYKVPGSAMVTIAVSKGGRIASASVQGKFAGTPTGTCVEAAAKTAKFPPCEAMSFPWPFQLH
jgi:hypothetical protein